MKIAVTYENNQVYQHFGHTKEFKIYNVSEKGVLKTIVGTNGQGHGALAEFLKKNNVDVVICGGMGPCAKEALAKANIKVYPGITGSCDEAVEKLLNNTLEYNPNSECADHAHHHHDGHSCGGHN